jgi:SAM-dependent methyltransferase
MSTTAETERAAEPWSLARRTVTGLTCPGGRAAVARALQGIGYGEGDRVVELAPGAGLTSVVLLEGDPRSWIGVEPDALAREHLERAVLGESERRAITEKFGRAPDREGARLVVDAPVDATGLPADSATVVVADGLLCTQEAAGRATVLAEAARLLRAGGRLAVLDLAPAPGASAEALAELAGAGVRPATEAGLRAEVEATGLVPTGSLVGPLDLPAPRDLMRGLGPRMALRLTREGALDAGVRAAATRGRQTLERHALALRSLLVIAEMPLILGMRRPRR